MGTARERPVDEHDVLGSPGDSIRARRRWLAAALIGSLLVLMGAAAAYGGGPSRPGSSGAAVGAAAVRPAYQGHYVTPDDVATLRAAGLATTSVRNRELTCQGIELFFDTLAERDAYLAAYGSRYPVEPPYLDGDPCRPFRDAPVYVVSD